MQQLFIETTGKVHNVAGIGHDRYAKLHFNKTLDKALKTIVRVLAYNDSIVFETLGMTTPKQSGAIKRLLKQGDYHCVIYTANGETVEKNSYNRRILTII